MSKEKENKKLKIIKSYCKLVSKGTKFPTRTDLKIIGISQDMVRHHFGTYSQLRAMAKAAIPDSFSGVLAENDYLSKGYQKQLKEVASKHKVFMITTAVNGQPVHESAFKSAKNYLKKRNGTLLILPCHDPAHNLDNEIEWHFDESISKENFVFKNLELNESIQISGTFITAKQVNPLTGLSRFAQKQYTTIFRSPKRTLEYVPTSNVKYPRALMTPGSITLPNYSSTKGNSLRSADIATHDHVMGAVIVEIVNEKMYHFRQVSFDSNGGFCDLGSYYLEASVKKMAPKFVMGDLHPGETDESAFNAWKEVIAYTQADEVIVHDGYNGEAISHWTEDDIIVRAQHAKENLLSLERELFITGQALDQILMFPSVKRVTMSKSNHDEFLARWLKRGAFNREPHNFTAGCALATAAVDGKDPLDIGLQLYGKMKHKDRLKMLSRDEDYKIAGIELGSHGDKGPNGSKGTKSSLEKAYGSCVIGHSHTPGILRGVWQVGTTTKLRLSYNQGPSSWVHCSCLVYPNGQRQLINSFNGKWRLESK